MTMRYPTLPIEQWPDADRKAWEDACRHARRLVPGGRAGSMKQATRTSMRHAYGYLLAFCRRTGGLDLRAAACAHVTPEVIADYVAELQLRVGSVTRHTYLARVESMMRILAPERDRRWLADIVLELKDQKRPRNKASRIIPSDRLLALGLDLINKARTPSGTARGLEQARIYRNRLMVALMALCPIRLGNFARLRIGHDISRIDGCWWIILASGQTRSNRPDERPINPVLTGIIDDWIDHWRPCFKNTGEAMWPSGINGALAYTYVGGIITETTQRAFGIEVNPHLFRDCAVHTIAHRAGRDMGVASALLQHTDARVTQAHYNRGSGILAIRKYHAILAEIV